MALLAAPCSGCLVTGKHTFDEEPNSPPVILSKTGQPAIGKIVWIDNVQPEWRFEVRVRDEDVDDVLEARWRVRHLDDLEPVFESREVRGSGSALRDLEVVVNTANLIEYRCHQLELVVSGSFPGFTAPEFFDTVLPGDEDDVARAMWTIWEGQGPSTPPALQGQIAASCETIVNLLGTETMPTMEPR